MLDDFQVGKTVFDCDRALELLRAHLRDMTLERELVHLSIDRVLDRRLELLEASRAGAQS